MVKTRNKYMHNKQKKYTWNEERTEKIIKNNMSIYLCISRLGWKRQ